MLPREIDRYIGGSVYSQDNGGKVRGRDSLQGEVGAEECL